MGSGASNEPNLFFGGELRERKRMATENFCSVAIR